MKCVLSIAGSDCSGGAGIQADLKTIAAHSCYGMSAITALTAQNTMGVYGIEEVSSEFLAKELDCIFTDIYPDAVKIGMVATASLIYVIADKLRKYTPDYVVLDPVMISTSGSRLLNEEAMEALIHELVPLASIITPNLMEAESLSGIAIQNKDNMIEAALKLSQWYQGAILMKGGHMMGAADDLLFQNGQIRWYPHAMIDNPNTHGTGCTLSSAIAANLAMGHSMEESVDRAKAYITGAIADGLNLGHGHGPLNHMFQKNEADLSDRNYRYNSSR